MPPEAWPRARRSAPVGALHSRGDGRADRRWVVAELRERGVRRRVAAGLAVRRVLREERPERAHRRAQLVFRLGHRVDDEARELREPDEIELERRPRREEAPQRVEVLLPQRVARDERIEQRQGERDVFQDPLGVELVVRLGELGRTVGEDERDDRLQLGRFSHAAT